MLILQTYSHIASLDPYVTCPSLSGSTVFGKQFVPSLTCPFESNFTIENSVRKTMLNKSIKNVDHWILNSAQQADLHLNI